MYYIFTWQPVGSRDFCISCFTSIQLLPLPGTVFGLLYLLGVFAFDAMNPLMNALNVSYTTNGYTINYGLSRGLGSLAYSFAALGIGKVMARFGADWMIWISLALMAANTASSWVMPPSRWYWGAKRSSA